nr:hypothetical protein CFP56_62174 [Quercus suber]
MAVLKVVSCIPDAEAPHVGALIVAILRWLFGAGIHGDVDLRLTPRQTTVVLLIKRAYYHASVKVFLRRDRRQSLLAANEIPVKDTRAAYAAEHLSKHQGQR